MIGSVLGKVGSFVTGSVLIGMVVVICVVEVGVGSIVTGSVLTAWDVVVMGVVIGGGRAVISSCGGGSIHCHDQTQTYKKSLSEFS